MGCGFFGDSSPASLNDWDDYHITAGTVRAVGTVVRSGATRATIPTTAYGDNKLAGSG